MTDTEKILAEKSELDSLIGAGMSFEIGKRKFIIREPYLGTLDLLSRLFVDMSFDDEKMKDNPLQESKMLAARVAKDCAKVVAVAVLNGRWRIRLFSRILTGYFYWKAKPSVMLKLALIVNTMCNFGDFTTSIRLMSGVRTTAPNRIED